MDGREAAVADAALFDLDEEASGMEFLMRSDSEAVTRAHVAITSESAGPQAHDGANAKFVQLSFEDESDLPIELAAFTVGGSNVLAMLDRLADLVRAQQVHHSTPGHPGPIAHHALPLLSLDAHILAVVALREAVGANQRGAGEPTFNRVAGRIGSEARQRQRQLQRLRDERKDAPGLNNLRELLAARRVEAGLHDALDDLVLIDEFRSLVDGTGPWKRLGDVLLWLSREAGIVLLDRPTRRERLVSLSPGFSAALEAEADPAVLRLLRRPTDLPMISEPAPWNGVRGGGWLVAAAGERESSHRHHLVKHHRHPPRIALLDAAAESGRLHAVLGAVNALQNTGWTIDPVLLALQRLLIAGDGQWFPGILGAGALERLREDVEPPYRSLVEGRPGADDPGDDVDDDDSRHGPHEQLVVSDYRHYQGERMRRDQALQALVRAGELQDRMGRAQATSCHIPVQLDLRGRVYAQPALSPLDRDSVRALFRFSEGVALDGAGTRWLAVNVANRYGPRAESGRHLSAAERESWTHANEPLISALASVRTVDGGIDPVAASAVLGPDTETGRWWREAKDPWQFLAACFEWADRGTPGFRSHLPVILDGTANGLQHMSALCRDAAGAVATNVIPDPTSPGPNDGYARIAAQVRGWIEPAVSARQERFKVAGLSFETSRLEPWLPHLDRRLVKRVALAVPYGATVWSTSNTILEAFDELPPEARSRFPRGSRTVSELNRLIWAATRQTVPTAERLRIWLRRIAAALAAANLGVQWTTASGLPVLVEAMAYGEVGQHQTRTPMADGHKVHGSWVDESLDPEALRADRQKNGITAHLVHSLDAAHLVAVVNALAEQGVASVLTIHDAFGVHATQVGVLREVLRTEFHRLHVEPVLDQFIQAQVQRVDEMIAGMESGEIGAFLPNGLPADLRALRTAATELRSLRATVPHAKKQFDPDGILDARHLFD